MTLTEGEGGAVRIFINLETIIIIAVYTHAGGARPKSQNSGSMARLAFVYHGLCDHGLVVMA